MLSIIDRYLAREIARSYLAIVAVTITILSLENLTRLTSAVERTDNPGLLLGQLMATLIPEYLAIAIPVATFLAVAFAIRTLSLRSEWQMFGGLGLSPARIMALPMLLALGSAAVQLAVRLEVQPAGESALDRISLEIARGLHGMGLVPGELFRLPDGTSVIADRLAFAGPGQLANVVVHRGTDILVGNRASVSISPSGAINLILRRGNWFRADQSGERQVVHFGRFVVQLGGVVKLRERTVADAMDRLGTQALLAGAARERGEASKPMFAALLTRIEGAGFCLLLPLFALALGTPPKRSSGGSGIFLGIVLIVVHFRSAAAIEAMSTHPLLAVVLHALVWTALAGGLAHAALHNEPGFIDSWIARRAAETVARVRMGLRQVGGGLLQGRRTGAPGR